MLERLIIIHHAALLPGPCDEALGRWLAVLPEGHRKRVAGLDPADRRASLLGIALLLSCARAAGLDPDRRALEFPEGGKPRWRGCDDFSVSHVGGRVACALAPPGGEIGLDIELRAAVTVDSLRLVTSEDERGLVISGRLDAAALWTRKEALLKAAGRGLRDVAAARAGVEWGTLEQRRYWFLDVDLAPDVACVVAASAEAASLVVRELDGGALLAGGP